MAPFNDYSNPYYRFDIKTDILFKLLGNVEKRDLTVLNRLLKNYFVKTTTDSIVRCNPIMANDEIAKIESTNYNALKEIYEKFTGKSLFSFEISDNTSKVVDWLLERNDKNMQYRIVSLFEKDLSIVFDDPKAAMEFKLRFSVE